MPSFMLNNGLLKLLCQLIAITTDHSSLKRQACALLLVVIIAFVVHCLLLFVGVVVYCCT